MILETIDDRRYARFERLGGERGLVHAFSLRGFDVSARFDAHAAQREARRATMARDWELDPSRLCFCDQVHRPQVTVIDAPRAGGLLAASDAVVTDVPAQPMMVFSADCPLVLVFDPNAAVLGLAHASWRCTVGRVSEILVRTMRERFGCVAGDLLAGIGPSAGPRKYEVKQDVYEAAGTLSDRDQLFARREGRMYFDLWEANRRALLAAGVGKERIELAGICTIERADLFYSYRREGAGCGHFGLIAALAGE